MNVAALATFLGFTVGTFGGAVVLAVAAVGTDNPGRGIKLLFSVALLFQAALFSGFGVMVVSGQWAR